MFGRSLVVAAAIAAAVLVPAAQAAHRSTVKLPLVPLQKSQLGVASRSLPLEHDSGPVSNATAANNASGKVTVTQLEKLGRVTGYQLDYGNPFLPGKGVREIETGVERYRSAAGAKKGLAFWKKDELQVASLAQFGVKVALKGIHAPRIAAAHWAYVATLTIPNTTPIYGVDEDVRDGNYLVSVSVAAGSLRAAEHLAPKLAKKVDARLRAMLDRKLRGRPAKLPARLEAGPPSSGPDPAKAAFATSDFTQATLSSEHYVRNQEALSEYLVALRPAGSFAGVFQEIVAESTSSEATYYGALLASSLANLAAGGSGLSNLQMTPVDLSGVGDSAYGALLQFTLSGQTIYEGALVLVNGPLVELVFGAAKTAIAASDVTSLAQVAAAKLNAAVSG
ncbi:MAG TPA: hypothetical protein VE088_04765 [Gaiellaceae bacterium]|nr:hypothetical protein [Gaiellaceae bacterium]